VRLYLPKDIGGTIEWDALQRPSQDPTIEVRAGNGSAVVAAATAANRSSVSTTLSSAAAAEAETVSVADGTGITQGERYRVAGAGAPDEQVECKSISGTTVTLRRPLIYGHANAATFEGVRLSYALTAAQAATEYDDCWAIFSWETAAGDQPPGRVDLTISRGYVTNPLTPDRLRVADPHLTRRVSAYADLDEICRLAFHEVLERLRAGGMPVQDLVAACHRIEPAVRYLALYMIAEQYGADYAEERERRWNRFENVFQVFGSTAPVDEDRDNAISTHEKWTAPSITLRRVS
jgi:hypothetical protein